MAKRKPVSTVDIGQDMAGNLIQGDGNTITQNDLDPEELRQGFQGVSDAIYETSSRSHWAAFLHRDNGEDSRRVLGTVFVSFFSAIGIGASWNLVAPYNRETVPFFILLALALGFVLRSTNFGVRYTLMVTLSLWLGYLSLINFWGDLTVLMNNNLFVGTAILSVIGALIGLVDGILLMFWKPLGD